MNVESKKAESMRGAAFVRVGRVEDFPEGRGKRVHVSGRDVAVFHVGSTFHALLDRCTHADAPLSRGKVKDGSVMCPRHGAHFDLRTGAVLTLQAVRNVEAFDVIVEGGELFVGTAARIAEPMWQSGRRLDQEPSDPSMCRSCAKDSRNSAP